MRALTAASLESLGALRALSPLSPLIALRAAPGWHPATDAAGRLDDVGRRRRLGVEFVELVVFELGFDVGKAPVIENRGAYVLERVARPEEGRNGSDISTSHAGLGHWERAELCVALPSRCRRILDRSGPNLA